MEQSATESAKTADVPEAPDTEESALASEELEPLASEELETLKAEDEATKSEGEAEPADAKAETDAKGETADGTSETAEPNSNGNGKAKSAADDEPNGAAASSDWSAGRLSSVEAEGFADEFRPSWGGASWETEAAAPVPAVSEQVVPVPVSKPLSEEPAAVSFDYEPASLPGAKNSTKMLAAVALGFAVLVGVIVVSFSTSEDAPEPTASANPPVEPEREQAPEVMVAQSQMAAAPTMEVVPEPVEVVPEAPPMVRVQVRTVPENATLELDGEPIPNPFDREVLQDGSTHQLRATAPNHREAVATLSYDGQQSETLTLEEIPAPPPVMEPEPVMAAAMVTRRVAMSTRSMRRGMRTMRRGMRASMMAASSFTSDNPY